MSVAESMTLRDCFERFYRSDELLPRTIEAYQNTLKHWERITSNPPVAHIDNAVLRDFKVQFLAEGKSPATFNKNRQHILSVLNLLGPPSHARERDRENLGLLTAVPYVRKARESEKRPVVYDDRHVDALYAGCAAATWPRYGGEIAIWWRTAIVLGFNVGARRNDWLSLQWSAIDLDRRELTLHQGKTRKVRVLPLHSTAVEHLRSLRSETASPLVFPTRPDAAAPVVVERFKTSLYRTWRAIHRAGGLTDPADYRTFHQLRATCATNLWESNPGHAQQMLCHSSAETTRRHYAHTDPGLRRAVDAIQQPAAFVRGEDPGDPPPPPDMILKFPA